jgi:L-seryl-tRNA(Ser) seleniumtransferase
VVIPKHSRNEYDQAIRSVGVRVIEVGDTAEYEAALGPKVVMVYVFAGQRAENGPLPYEAIYTLAKKKNIPVLVDAAAEMLTIPNVHLQRGATLVGYSGGKCIRGPQCAGILLGRKDLVKAAWMSSAPHHGHGRTMKVGKEEAIGMLAAVEMWVKRDHKAEDQMWTSWMNNIAARVFKIDGVKTAVREPRGLSNHSPGLSITWDPAKLGITGEEVSNTLFTTEPRIALNGGGGGGRGARANNETGISITAYMMSPGEDKIVGDRIYQILSAARPASKAEPPKAPAGDLTGRWDVRIEFAAGGSDHTLHVRQQGTQLEGTHQGDFLARDLSGIISGDDVRISSNIGEVHGAALSYRFSGKLAGDKLSGSLNMGEYLSAKWSATRHAFSRGQSTDIA